MAYRIVYGERFREDLDDTYFYYAVKLGMVNALRSFDQELSRAFGLMSEMPELHAVSGKPALASRGVREWPVGGYVILYRIIGDEVFLIRLLHQSRDVGRHVLE